MTQSLLHPTFPSGPKISWARSTTSSGRRLATILVTSAMVAGAAFPASAVDVGLSPRFLFAEDPAAARLTPDPAVDGPNAAARGYAGRSALATEAADPGVGTGGTGVGTTGNVDQRRRDWDVEMAARKSYWIPALDIIGFQVLLNRFDRYREGSGDYDVTAASIRRNLRHSWVVDSDPFSVNQFLHPYAGSMYYGFARSAGLDFWQSFGYTFAGSAVWEVFGENTFPSRNDQIATGIGGTFLGEALFRMSSLVLERQDHWPTWLHEMGAAAISPSTGFNRLAFGDRFKPIFPSHDADYYSRLQFGFTGTTQNDPGNSQRVRRNEAVVDFSLDYGLPGKPDYAYRRPFDYFTLQMTGASGNGLESIMTKGLLLGRDYKVGDKYRGIWGLYGSYDYLAPQIFRLSSTALSLGTTGQYWLTDTIAVQGTGMLGAGYAAVGTLHGTDERDYHYGVAPQALLALRLIFGEKYSLDVTGREYFVSRVGSTDANNHDNIARLETALTWRISGPHAVALKYVLSRRDPSYAALGNSAQTRGTIGVFYTLLGHDRFGAAEWRK